MKEKTKTDALVRHQQQRKSATLEKAQSVMLVIEAEIKEYGTYPHNNGVVNLAELCRRAEIGSTTLRNKHHHSTRDIVQAWLAGLKRKAPTGKADAYAFRGEKISFYEEAIRQLNAEAVEWRAELSALAGENQKLRVKIATMSGGAANVVGINRRKKSHD